MKIDKIIGGIEILEKTGSVTTDEITAACSTLTRIPLKQANVLTSMAIGNLIPRSIIDSYQRRQREEIDFRFYLEGVSTLTNCQVTVTELKEFCTGAGDQIAVEDYDGNLVHPGEFRFSYLRADRLHTLISSGMKLEEAKEFIRDNESTSFNFDIAFRGWKCRRYKNDPIFDYDPLCDTVSLNTEKFNFIAWWLPLERSLFLEVKKFCYTSGVPEFPGMIL